MIKTIGYDKDWNIWMVCTIMNEGKPVDISIGIDVENAKMAGEGLLSAAKEVEEKCPKPQIH